jgi:hypothetical protein
VATISNFPTFLKEKELHVNNAVLLMLYLVIPATILVVVADLLFFGGSIKSALPDRPDLWAFWTVIFNLPHIIASIITFADKEYATYYKKQLIIGSALCLFLAAGIPFIFGNMAAFVVMASYTMYHVMMQQYGIGLMMLWLKPDSGYHYWRISSIIGASLLFLLVYSREHIPSDIITFIKAIITVSIVFSWWFTFGLYGKAKEKDSAQGIAFWYFVGNSCMMTVCYLFFLSGYHAFVIVIPRVIHDITAYIIYTVHDHNRNRDKPNNIIYAPFIAAGIPALLLCAPISIGIGYVLMRYHSQGFITTLVFFLIFFHYYIEGHVWRKGTPHRRHVGFV